MRNRLAVMALGMALLAGPVGAAAASPWMDGGTYSEKVGGKLKYGLTNALLGWTSLFRTPVAASKSGDNVVVGIGQGIWDAVGQTIGGALHVVTFPLTSVDVPLPKGGTDILG